MTIKVFFVATFKGARFTEKFLVRIFGVFY